MKLKNVFEYEKTKNSFYNILNEKNKWDMKMLKTDSKQGFLGVVSIKDVEMVFKLSQHINYLIEHEYYISKSLVGLSDYCIHFCKSIDMINSQISEKFRFCRNPFTEPGRKIYTNIMFMEYIKDTYSLYDYIRYNKINDDVLYSSIKQVLLANIIAYEYKKFTHYDLHSCNIMMKQCNKDVVFLYVLDENNQFIIPTFGNYPIIIDYGFSYCSDMENNPMYCSLGFTDNGFTSCIPDELFDYKLFLTSTSNELYYYRKNEKNKKFRKVVYNLFRNLRMDKSNGWDKLPDNNISKNLVNILGKNKNIIKNSIFNNKYIEYSLDLFNSLIILPNQLQDYSQIQRIFSNFLLEWNKIEREISNSFYNIYILKGIIEIVKSIREEFLNNINNKQIITTFKNSVYEKIDEVVKFCNPKNINFETLLCSIILLSRNIEGFYHNELEKIKEERKQSYENVPLKTKRQIFSLINLKLDTEYIFNNNTIIVVFDVVKKQQHIFQLNEKQIKTLNMLNRYYKDNCVYEYYKKSLQSAL
jgi:hypothetical protein